MPDEVGTEATRSDTPSVDDNLFGDAPEDETAADPAAENANGEDPQEAQDSDEAEQEPQGSDDTDARDEAASTEDDLKVVVSIKGGRATIGVQRPESDPHIESFDGLDESGVTQEVPAVIGRARAAWEDAPKHPAYERPAPPARRRSRREQGTAQAANAEAETEQAQQQTLRLF